MGLDDILGKAKEMLGANSDKVDGAIDSAAAAIKDKTPDNVDGMVDTAAEKAKDVI